MGDAIVVFAGPVVIGRDVRIMGGGRCDVRRAILG